MTSKATVSLSKCCFIAIIILNTGSSFSQHVITVKKKIDSTKVETKPDSTSVAPIIQTKKADPFRLTGFFYSEPFTLSTGRPGEPPTDFRRMIVYIDEYGRVYLFHTVKSVKKLYEKFAKNPDKYTEEYGSLELTPYGDLYLSTQPRNTIYGSYKYVGDVISEKQFYIDYKATIDSKVAIKVYLYKY